MKKNILTFFILTLCIANITLTAILMFAMLPSFQKTNRLITQVSEILDLELTKNENPEEGEQAVNVEDLVLIKLAFDAKQTVNLKREEGSKENKYVLFDFITVSLDSKAKDFKKVQELLTTNDTYAKEAVINILGSYSMADLNKQEICEKAAATINELYKTDCVVIVTIEGYMVG